MPHLPANILNQFTYSGALLVLMGGVMTQLKSVPEAIWDWFLRQTTIEITVKDDDPAFEWTKEWLLEQDFMRSLRRVDLDSTIRGKLMSLLPAPGKHFFWRNKRPFWIDFYRSEDKKASTWARSESFKFMTVGRSPRILEQFVAEVIASQKNGSIKNPGLYVWEDYWRKNKSYVPRSLDTVLLPDGQRDALVGDVTAFFGNKQMYRDLGIPYHRGYVFYGPPGTGKTSLASGLAKEMGMSVYLLSLNDHTDKSLKEAMVGIPERSIILFEDIDASGAAKKRLDKKPSDVNTKKEASESLKDILGVTLSGLLNVLDGFLAPDSVLFVMTTNHIDNLDPALLRPGRIDYKLFMGEATHSQKTALYLRFFPDDSLADAEEFLRSRPQQETMAEFQGLLLTKDKKGDSL